MPKGNGTHSLQVKSPFTKYLLSKKDLEEYFTKSGFFSQIEVIEEYESSEKNNSDLIIEMDYIAGGFFEPYCIFTLAIIPCTPPQNSALAIKVTNNKTNMVKTYFFKEEATQITWALGFLIPNSGHANDKIKDLHENILNNLMTSLKDDLMI